MSLDSLFHQILLTEQQLTEQAKTLQHVKVSIISCKEKIKMSTENCHKAEEELDKKAQQLSVMRLRLDLMKKREEQMLKQVEELLCQRSRLRDHLETIKRKSKDEEEDFYQEISRFNSEFSLRWSGDSRSMSQTHTEILDLEKKAQMLYKEMELMSQRSPCLNALQEERRTLQLQRQGLEYINLGLDQQMKEAQATAESLRAESLSVSQKPLSDSCCVRLREELELLKDGELELVREALSSEIHFLQSKLDSSQSSQSNQQH
ncbi:coiled-coil domain-containing protein 172-like [Genypterus blacodes]|uniref:coiled-coil domain-containing protein 172-like n=1 Tax=Genypterus blacodes TaxID=154954 RepID=UPI003F76402A